jgi:hypothetical protein
MVFPVWGLTLNVKVCSAEPGKCCNSHREFVMYQDEFLQNAALLNYEKCYVALIWGHGRVKTSPTKEKYGSGYSSTIIWTNKEYLPTNIEE